MSSSEVDTILTAAQKSTKYEEEEGIPVNGVSNVLRVIGWITLALGVIIGFIIIGNLKDPNSAYQSMRDPHPLRWVYGMSVIVSSFVSAVLFIGFSEVIKILHDIRAKIH